MNFKLIILFFSIFSVSCVGFRYGDGDFNLTDAQIETVVDELCNFFPLVDDQIIKISVILSKRVIGDKLILYLRKQGFAINILKTAKNVNLGYRIGKLSLNDLYVSLFFRGKKYTIFYYVDTDKKLFLKSKSVEKEIV